MKVKILTIVVTYNSIKWIGKCLDSLLSQNIDHDIFVVDNGSTDKTLEVISLYSSIFKVVSLSENKGFAFSNNVALKYGFDNNYEYFFLVNHDVYLSENVLDKLIFEHKVNNQFSIVSPVHLNGDGSKLDLNFARQCSEYFCSNLLSDLFLNSLNNIYEIKFVNAACWLVTRNCIEKVGYFEDMFFIYGEDNNFIQRLHFHKLKIAITPNVFINHDREDRKGKPSINSYYILTKSSFLEGVLNINSSFFIEFLKGIFRFNFNIIRSKQFIIFIKFNFWVFSNFNLLINKRKISKYTSSSKYFPINV